MKLNFLINSMQNGGAESALLTLINELLKQNHEINLILLEDENFYTIPKQINIIRLGKVQKNQILKFFSLVTLAFKLKKLKLDLINSHSFRANYVNILAKLFGSKHKAIITIHSDKNIYEVKNLNSKINLALINTLYKRADKTVFVSKSAQKSFNFNLPSQIIYNGFDIKNIEKLANENYEFEFKRDKQYLICVNRLIELKRVDDIIKALQLLNENFELIIIGDGSEMPNLQNLANDLNLKDRVHFLGQISNPFKYVKRADYFILASQSEAFGNVLIEAMICKTLVICSNFSVAKEILQDKGGILFETKNIQALANAIKSIDNKEKIVQSAYKRAVNFTISKTASDYEKIFKEI